MPSNEPKIHRSFPRLILGIVYLLFVLYFSKDLTHLGKGLFWPGVALMALGFALRFWAHGHIRKGEFLATGGPYGLTRNPLYLGSFVNGIGMAVAAEAYWVMAAGVVPLAVAYIVMIRGEHKNLEKKYGDEYIEYKKKVSEFFPFPTRYFFKPGERFSFSTAMHNRGWAALMYFAFTFLGLDLAVLAVWPSIIYGKPLFSTLADYFVNFIPNHF